MQIGGLSVAQPNVEKDNVCGSTSSSGEICRNSTVCGKICVEGAESTNPKTRVTKGRTMFKTKHLEGAK